MEELPAWIREAPLSRREALVDYRALLEGGVEFTVREWAERWQWTKDTAHRFIRRVLAEGLEVAPEGLEEQGLLDGRAAQVLRRLALGNLELVGQPAEVAAQHLEALDQLAATPIHAHELEAVSQNGQQRRDPQG